MLSAIADYERTQIRERLEAGKEYARAKGTKAGKPMHRPFITIDWAKFDELKRRQYFKVQVRVVRNNG